MNYLKGFWIHTLITPLLVIIDTVFELMIVSLISDVIDIGIPTGNVSFIVKTGMGMIGLSIVSAFCGSMGVWCAAKASHGLGANLRVALFSKIMDFSFSQVDEYPSAGLITRLTNDINNIQMTFNKAIRMMIRIPIMVFASLVMTFRISPKLSMILLAVIPILYPIIRVLMSRCTVLFQGVQSRLDNLNTNIQENLVALRAVRAFSRTEHQQKMFSDVNNELTDFSIRAAKWSYLVQPTIAIGLAFVTLAVLGAGSNMICAGGMSVGQLYAFLTFLTIIITSLTPLSSMITAIVRAWASATRVMEILNVESNLKITAEAKACDYKRVTFQNVSFKYSDKSDNVLSHISFSLEAGSYTALLGETGSGKTTIANLICGFYTPREGFIFLDDQDVSSYSPSELKKRISIVQQNCVLFYGTLRWNLLWGKPNATDEELWEALRIAQAEHFVRSLPQGLDTQVCQGGLNFSGGQRQRLCIARALVAMPSVLILDDATSAVDVHTERLIFSGLRSFGHNMTVLVITHRISALPSDWNIIFISDGEIKEHGINAELIKQSGDYSRLFEIQKEGDML